MTNLVKIKGGKGSGNFGHAGRPGKVGGSQSGEKIVKLRGSTSVDENAVIKAEAQKLGVSESTLRRMVSDRIYTPSSMNRSSILKNVVTQKFPNAAHDIDRNMDDDDLVVAAEVIGGLPDNDALLSTEIVDKDLAEGPSAFGTSGYYEPSVNNKPGLLHLSIQSDNTIARKAWAVAHEFGHSYSMKKGDEESLVLKNDDLMEMLGYGSPKNHPEAFEINGSVKDGYRSVLNYLNKYYGYNGPRMFAELKDVKPWTQYGHANPEEAFAEAFAGYMISPKALKKSRPELYNWLKKNIFNGIEYDGYSDECPSPII